MNEVKIFKNLTQAKREIGIGDRVIITNLMKDKEVDITSIDEFLNNNFNSNNDTFYELLNELKKDKENDKLQKELLNMLFSELDSVSNLENYDLKEVALYESDAFDNWLNYYEVGGRYG